jgi:hypothetical protein
MVAAVDNRPRSKVASRPAAARANAERQRRAARSRAVPDTDFFTLSERVGPGETNPAPEVAKTEILTSATGNLDLKPTKGPTGKYSAALQSGIRAFQKAKALQMDGIIAPKGPTIGALQTTLGNRFAGTRAPNLAELQAHMQAVAGGWPSPLGTGTKALRDYDLTDLTGEMVSGNARTVDSLRATSNYDHFLDLTAGDLNKNSPKATAGFGNLVEQLGKIDGMLAGKLVEKVVERLTPETRDKIVAEEPEYAVPIGKGKKTTDDLPSGAKKAEEWDNTKPAPAPTLYDEPERVANIQANKPARFEIEENPNADGGSVSWELSFLGDWAVETHNATIREMAEKHGVDPDLVRATMWTENARGHKAGFDILADVFGVSDRAYPMNIDKNKWSELVGKTPDDMYDPRVNIEAGVVLLDRITARIKNPTVEKIGSLWLNAGRELTHDFGAYIQRVYDEKPWEK